MDDPEATTNASGAWRTAMESSKPGAEARGATARGVRNRADAPASKSTREGPPPAKAPEAWEPEQWILEPDHELEREAGRAVQRGRAPSGPGGNRRRGSDESDEAIAGDVRAELAKAVGGAKVAKFESRLKDATRAFEAERFGDAARMLKRLAEEAPGALSVRELYGLTLYRQGKWRLAAKELEAFRQLSGSTEQNPVLADCYRALRQYRKVGELWDELGAASLSADLVTEGRIVAAGARADQGDVQGSIQLLAQNFTFPKRPKEHHLRRAYALADAYERAGDLGRARELFRRIDDADPGFADVRQRVRNLR